MAIAETQLRRIAVDVDGVLINFQGPFLQFYNQRHRTNFSMCDLFSYQFWKVFKIPGRELQMEMDAFYLSPLFRRLMPLEGSREAIKHLRKRNHLYVVTSRPDTLHDETQKSLQRHFPGAFLGLHFTNHYGGNGSRRNKSDFCLENGYETIIEDVVDYANECAEKGIKALLLTQPWNISERIHPSIQRCDTWREVLQHLN